jgi:ankyrin repeat protein
MTALHLAAKHGSENVALLLIERLKRENLICVDKNKMLALHHVAKCKTERIVVMEKLLNKYNLLIDAKHFGNILNLKDKFDHSILDLAIRENHVEMVEMLIIINDSFKHVRDRDENLPIHVNAISGSVQILELLNKHDFVSFDVNKNWNNAFHLAAYFNRKKFISKLLVLSESKGKLKSEANFALSAFNRDGLTPFMVAISKGSIECVELFIKYHSKHLYNFSNMFNICIENNQIETLKYLLNLNESLLIDEYYTKSDYRNNTLMHLVSIHKNFTVS